MNNVGAYILYMFFFYQLSTDRRWRIIDILQYLFFFFS